MSILHRDIEAEAGKPSRDLIAANIQLPYFGFLRKNVAVVMSKNNTSLDGAEINPFRSPWKPAWRWSAVVFLALAAIIYMVG
jgi:hypothetical protein